MLPVREEIVEVARFAEQTAGFAVSSIKEEVVEIPFSIFGVTDKDESRGSDSVLAFPVSQIEAKTAEVFQPPPQGRTVALLMRKSRKCV